MRPLRPRGSLSSQNHKAAVVISQATIDQVLAGALSAQEWMAAKTAHSKGLPLKDLLFHGGGHVNGFDFSGLTFENCRFIHVYFHGCRFMDVRLNGVTLSMASFNKCDFTRATGVLHGGADSDFYQCFMKDAAWSNSSISEASFRECSGSGLRLDRSNLRGTQFSDCRLWQAVFDESLFAEAPGQYYVRMSKCDLAGSSFRNARMNDMGFEGANLDECDFRGAALRNTYFSKARLRHTNLSDADLTGAMALDVDATSIRGARTPPNTSLDYSRVGAHGCVLRAD
jgi:uncharacterized protein YjbI with pentapeptide repeats